MLRSLKAAVLKSPIKLRGVHVFPLSGAESPIGLVLLKGAPGGVRSVVVLLTGELGSMFPVALFPDILLTCTTR